MAQSELATPYSDHADFYRRGPYSEYLTGRKIVGRQSAAMFSAHQPAGHFPDPPMPNVLLYWARKGAKEASFDWGAGRWRGAWRTSDLTLVPPNAASDVSLSERHRFCGICLPAAFFSSEVDPPDRNITDGLAPLYAAPFRDRLLSQLCETLWREGGEDGSGCILFADSALQLVVDRLGHLSAGFAAVGRSRATLSRKSLRRLDEFIYAHIHRQITVADLAAVMDLSPSHFSAVFRATKGQTPYRYVLSLRVERATELIQKRRDRSLVDVALASGFSSQSHMTAVFRQITGRTPASCRRNLS